MKRKFTRYPKSIKASANEFNGQDAAMAQEIADLGGELKLSYSYSTFTFPSYGGHEVSREPAYIIRVPEDIYSNDLKHQFEQILAKYNHWDVLKKVGRYSDGSIKLKQT